MTTQTASALQTLHHALDVPRGGREVAPWRWTVRRAMSGVRDALMVEAPTPRNGWLSERGRRMCRDRNALLGRLNALAHQVLENPHPEMVQAELARLLTDIEHHIQRLHDLAYDDVEMEIGGSE